jgi:hypothetical protein
MWRKKKQEGPDVGAVDVGVGHDDDLAVTALLEVEVLADAAAEGGNDRADLLVAEHLDEVGLLDVEDLSLEGEDGLDVGVAALLGGAAGGVAFDEEDLGLLVALGSAVGEFARQRIPFERVLASGELAGLAGGLAGLGGEDALLEDQLRLLGVLLEERPELLADGRVDERLDLRVQQLVLRLRFERRLGDLHGDDRSQALSEVVAAGADVLEQVAALGVAEDRVGEAGLEAGEVGAADMVVDVVRKGEDRLVVAVGVLEGDVDDELLRGVLGVEAEDL